MKEYLFLLFSTIFCITACQCTGQTPSSFSIGKIEELPFKSNVKTLDEFIARFNGMESMTGDKVPAEQRKITLRQATILRLFDYNVLAKANHNYKCDIEEFIRMVTDSIRPVHLNFADSNWHAQVTCKIKYRGQAKAVRLTMSSETQNKGFYWAISGVDPSFSQMIGVKKDSQKYISPTSHDREFMELKKAADTVYTASYFSKHFVPDALSSFYYALNKKELSILSTEQTSYHLLQIKGWIMVIKYYNRSSSNSGWLIEQLIRCDQHLKNMYLSEQLFLHPR